QYMVNHPDDAWRRFVASDKKLDDELNRRAWRDTLPRFALRPGALDRTRYNRFAKWLAERGMVEKMPPLDSYAVELAH
ncbi:MAG: putative hydroxymethylpyrimidine transport system substrate-binding protein, partial [Gammaproteobacteria bacterium]